MLSIWVGRTLNQACTPSPLPSAAQLDRKVAMETLDLECMQAVGLVQDQRKWRQEESRFNTRLNYTVNK